MKFKDNMDKASVNNLCCQRAAITAVMLRHENQEEDEGSRRNTKKKNRLAAQGSEYIEAQSCRIIR